MIRQTLQVGDKLPFFEGHDSQGQLISSSALSGRPAVIYFYPKDDTPGCSAEACSFRDAKTSFDASQAIVIGVSPDSIDSHKKFDAKYGLGFTLVSDPEHAICEAFGVWQEKTSFGKKTVGVVRTTFVVDRQGVIRWIERPVQVEGHSNRVLEALKTV